ncbi:chromate transporter [Clostridioides sp. ZZV15-6383]|uniref:chromate transporter n=1 Tax=unclassified Clostridioides TaxID=2635829 RepID=UPI001D121F33|nr:chromate transporter [Clostridioides sp. ZZV14-6345]MCC0700185.1 chromate transporter [Clostridioides sp. ZZV15-6383]
MKQSKKTYFWLLIINLFISTFTFGGGYVVVPMIRRYFVKQKKFFTEDDLVSMAAVAQSTPGAIAINLSALAGYRVAGTLGAVISCISAIIPPLVILGLVSAFYTTFISSAIVAAVLKGMQAGVAALIVDLIIDMCSMILKERSLFLSAMIPIAFFANFVMGINVALILIVCCFFCVVRVFCKKREDK